MQKMTTPPKPKGGARPGSGAKKTGRRKIWIPIAVREDRLQATGGEERAKKYLQSKADEI